MSTHDEGDPFIEWSEANDDGEAVLAAEREADVATAADLDLMPALDTAYEVVWPDGDIYANRHGEIRLTAAEARATARAIGGTWRAATAPGDSRLYFYKLTCGHETPNLYEQQPGTALVCRSENRAATAHPATVVRLTRVRDTAPNPSPAQPTSSPGASGRVHRTAASATPEVPSDLPVGNRPAVRCHRGRSGNRPPGSRRGRQLECRGGRP